MHDDVSARMPAALAGAHALCESKLAGGDIDQYYSLLFLPPERRKAAVALHAFWLEVREINDECADPGVARLKLGWWHEEIQEMAAGRPRHPIAVALAPAVATCQLPHEPFFELIEALMRHATAAGYATFDALREHGARTRGRLETLAARLTGRAGPAVLERAMQLGALLELTALLRTAGADARRERIYLPQDDLARFGVGADDLRGGEASEPLRAFVAFEVDRLWDELERAVAPLSAADRAPLLPLVIAAELARAWLEKLRRDPARLARERTRLAPLRQLWIAWRMARRASGTVTP